MLIYGKKLSVAAARSDVQVYGRTSFDLNIPTPTPTMTPTMTPSSTAIPLTPTPTATVTPSITVTASPTPSITMTPSVTASVTATVTPTLTRTPTLTATASITATPTPTVSLSPTPGVTATATPTLTATRTVTATPSLTASITPTITISATLTPTPTPTTSQDAVSTDFDYAVVRFIWGEPNGTDLDIRVSITDPARNVVVGADRAANDGTYLVWGGDNQQPYGQEAVLLGFNDLKNDYPALSIFDVSLEAFWYGIKRDGNMRVEFVSYKGGTMQQTPQHDFINVGGQIVDSKSIWVNSQMQGGLELDGEEVATLVFNSASNLGQLIVDQPAVTPTPTATVTMTATSGATPTPTPSVTATVTPTISITPTVTADVSPTVTPTISITPTITRTMTATATVTPTVTADVSPTPTRTVTPTISVTPSITPTISNTPSITPTLTASPEPTKPVTPTVTNTVTPTISITPSITPSTSISPTITPTITISPSLSATPTATPQTPVLWYDNFSTNRIGEYTTSTWSIPGTWVVGSDVMRATVTQSGSQTLCSPTGVMFTDGYVSADCNQADDGGIALRITDNKNYYLFSFTSSKGEFSVYSCKNGSWTNLILSQPIPGGWAAGTMKNFKFSAIGTTLTAYIDGAVVYTTTNTVHSSGNFAMRNNGTGGTSVSIYDNFMAELIVPPTPTPTPTPTISVTPSNTPVPEGNKLPTTATSYKFPTIAGMTNTTITGYEAFGNYNYYCTRHYMARIYDNGTAEHLGATYVYNGTTVRYDGIYAFDSTKMIVHNQNADGVFTKFSMNVSEQLSPAINNAPASYSTIFMDVIDGVLVYGRSVGTGAGDGWVMVPYDTMGSAIGTPTIIANTPTHTGNGISVVKYNGNYYFSGTNTQMIGMTTSLTTSASMTMTNSGLPTTGPVGLATDGTYLIAGVENYEFASNTNSSHYAVYNGSSWTAKTLPTNYELLNLSKPRSTLNNVVFAVVRNTVSKELSIFKWVSSTQEFQLHAALPTMASINPNFTANAIIGMSRWIKGKLYVFGTSTVNGTQTPLLIELKEGDIPVTPTPTPTHTNTPSPTPNITPSPTSNQSTLLNMPFNSDFDDISENPVTVHTVGNPTIAGNALVLDGAPSYLYMDYTSKLATGVSNFTISVDVNLTDNVTTTQHILNGRNTVDGNGGIVLFVENGKVGFYSAEVGFTRMAVQTLVTNTWYNITLRRIGNTFSLLVDDEEGVSFYLEENITTGYYYIGAVSYYPAGLYPLIGMVRNLKITSNPQLTPTPTPTKSVTPTISVTPSSSTTVSSTFAQFSTVNKSKDIALSDNNLTVVYSYGGVSPATYNQVFADTPLLNGKYYWEVTVNPWNANGEVHGIGIALASVPLESGTVFAGANTAGTSIWGPANVVYFNNAKLSITKNTATTVVTYFFAYDSNESKIWFGDSVNGWYNGGNPSTGTAPILTSTSLDVGDYYPVISLKRPNNTSITANFGKTTFVGTVPTGFTAGIPIITPTPTPTPTATVTPSISPT
jgi:hypothetical protein